MDTFFFFSILIYNNQTFHCYHYLVLSKDKRVEISSEKISESDQNYNIDRIIVGIFSIMLKMFVIIIFFYHSNAYFCSNDTPYRWNNCNYPFERECVVRSYIRYYCFYF